MTTYPQIQSYIGADSGGYGNGNTGAVIINGRLYVLLTGSGAAGNIIVYDVPSGSEVGFATAAAIGAPAITLVWCITYAGLIFMQTGTPSGKPFLNTIDPSTLSVVASWNGPPSSGIGALGFFVPMLSPDNINFAFGGAATGGGFAVFQAQGSAIQFAGHLFAPDEPFASSCGGNAKNIVFTACHHTFPTTSAVGIYKTTVSSGAGNYNVAGLWPGTPNANIATTKVGTISPATVDATWTHFSDFTLLGVDASDGHLIVQLSTTDSVTHKSYVAKINETSLAIIWQTPDLTASAGVSQPNNSLVWMTVSVVNSVNLSTGAATVPVTFGQTPSAWSQIGQFYDYKTNSIYTWGEYITVGGTPPYPVPGFTAWGTTDNWYRVILGPEQPVTVFTAGYYIERMDNRIWPNIETAWCLDAALALPQPAPSASLTASYTTGFVTFTANAGVFTSSDVGSVLRMGGGIATITTYSSTTTVIGSVTSPITAIYPDDPNNIPLPAATGSWTLTVPTMIVSGLDHLEGLTVAALADGSVVSNLTVVSGSITLPQSASQIVVGLPFTAQLQTLYLEAEGAGTLQSKRKNVTRATLRVQSSIPPQIGTNQPDASAQPNQATIAWGAPPYASMSQITSTVTTGVQPLYSGDFQITNVFDNWGTNGQIAVQQTNPVPLTVLALVPWIDAGDQE